MKLKTFADLAGDLADSIRQMEVDNAPSNRSSDAREAS
jgi:hypothetical protein